METFVLPYENSHFSMVTSSLLHLKTEVRSRSGCEAGALLGIKIAALRPPAAHETVAGLVFGAQNGQHCNLILSSHRHGEFIAYVVVNTCSR